MQTAFRAGVRAFSTADTLRRTGNLPPGKGHRTSPFTSPAVNASLLVPLKLHQAEAVEPAINRPQWTQILTEGPEHLHRQQDNAQQNSQLPEEQSPSLTSQRLIRPQQRKGPQQSAGGTEVFAEGRYLGESTEQKHGAKTHQQNQRRIFPVFQDPVSGQTFSLFKQGDLIQKVLYQSEGAQPAANKTPQKAPKYEEESQRGKGRLYPPLVQQRLQGPNGT